MCEATVREVMLRLPEAAIHGEWIAPPVAGVPVVVFLHDGLGCTRALRDFPARVAAHLGTGAFAYDRVGYGRSSPRDPFPLHFMEEEAWRLPRVLDAAGIGACCLVGHSDGGTIALLHAAADPSRLRATVTIAAHVVLDRLTRAKIARNLARFEAGGIPDYLRDFHRERARAVIEGWGSLQRRPEYRDWDIREAIGAVRTPLFACQGEHDGAGLPEQLEWIREAVPHAHTRLLPGLGHFPHAGDPEGTARLVAEFLAPFSAA